MDYKTILVMFSGPIKSAIRSAVLGAMATLSVKLGMDGDTTAAVATGLIAVLTWGLNVAISAPSVQREAVAKQRSVAEVKLTNGETIVR